MKSNQTDAELIKALGGPSRVAEIIFEGKPGSAQRVQNWISRGIPSHIKVKRPDLFMPELDQAPANHAQEATKPIAA